MEKEAYLLIGALGGALITAFFAVVNSWLTSKREISKRNRDETIKALYDIHKGLSDLRLRFNDISVHSLKQFASGEILEIDSKPLTVSAEEIELQLAVFAPSLVEKFDHIKEKMRTITNDFIDSSLMVASKEIDKSKLQKIIDRGTELSPKIDDFQNELSKHIRKERKKG